MTANKLAEALKIISNYSKATIITGSRDRKDWAEDVAFIGKVAVEALALHEAEIALAALTAEQKRLGMYEKQEPVLVHAGSSEMLACFDKLAAARNQDRLDAERYRELRPGRHWSVIDWIGNDLRGDVLDVSIDKAIAAKEAKP